MDPSSAATDSAFGPLRLPIAKASDTAESAQDGRDDTKHFEVATPKAADLSSGFVDTPHASDSEGPPLDFDDAMRALEYRNKAVGLSSDLEDIADAPDSEGPPLDFDDAMRALEHQNKAKSSTGSGGDQLSEKCGESSHGDEREEHYESDFDSEFESGDEEGDEKGDKKGDEEEGADLSSGFKEIADVCDFDGPPLDFDDAMTALENLTKAKSSTGGDQLSEKCGESSHGDESEEDYESDFDSESEFGDEESDEKGDKKGDEDEEKHVPLMKVCASPGCVWLLQLVMVAGIAFISGAFYQESRCQCSQQTSDVTIGNGKAFMDNITYFAVPVFGKLLTLVAITWGTMIDG